MAAFPVELLGLGAGWIVCLLLDRLGLIAFSAPSAGTAIPSWCTAEGYPKAQDWFWYAAFAAAGVAGAWLASWLHRNLRGARRASRLPDFPVWPAAVLFAAATALLFSAAWSAAPGTLVLALLAVALPWFSRRWYAAPAPGPAAAAGGPGIPAGAWVALCLAVAAAFVADRGIGFRPFDTMHEGGHLLYIQGYLAGDLGAGTIRTEYGRLYTWSIVWWMKVFGFDAMSLRWYFAAAQAAGILLCLAALRLAAPGRTGAIAGAWLMLTASCAAPYGWANILRVALPLASVVLFFAPSPGRRPVRLYASGALAAAGLLYSPEFGIAGLAAGGFSFVVARRASAPPGRAHVRELAAWAGAAAATFILLWIAMYGVRAFRVLSAAPPGGYLLSRLMGHGVRPLPVFAWSRGEVPYNMLWRSLSVWGPALLACATAAVVLVRGGARGAGTGPLKLALASFTFLAFIPAVARPESQQAMPACAWIVLAAVWLGELARRHRGPAVAAAVVLAAWGLVAPAAGLAGLAARWTTPAPAGYVATPADSRFGGLRLPPVVAAQYDRSVDVIHKLCPPGRRIFIAAPYHPGLSFIADRACMAPFPQSLLAVSDADRKLMVEALDRDRTPVAIVTLESLDMPLPEADPGLWQYVQEHYRIVTTVRDLIFSRRVDTP